MNAVKKIEREKDVISSFTPSPGCYHANLVVVGGGV